MRWKLILCILREGRSNAHVKGDYQRIGDVMLRNMCALKVRILCLALYLNLLFVFVRLTECLVVLLRNSPATYRSTTRCWQSWRKPPRGWRSWRLFTKSLSCRRSATCPSTHSCSSPSSASCTTSSSWRDYASIILPYTVITMTARVSFSQVLSPNVQMITPSYLLVEKGFSSRPVF